MALTDILSRIENDADGEASVIVDAAKRETGEQVDKARTRAGSRRDQIMADARRDAERERGTTLANARLQARDQAVEARHELAGRALRRAEEALAALPDERYAALLAERIVAVARGGETLLIAPDDTARLSGLSDALAAAARDAGVSLDLTFGDEPAELPHGVLLTADRMSVEISPRSFVIERREELLALAAATLFGDEG